MVSALIPQFSSGPRVRNINQFLSKELSFLVKCPYRGQMSAERVNST